MNTLTVVCLLLGFLVLGQATYIKPRYPGRQLVCFDYRGWPVLPSQRYYDGCNWCTCGWFGRPTACTYRLCEDFVRPVYPVSPVKPVKPIEPVHPVPY